MNSFSKIRETGKDRLKLEYADEVVYSEYFELENDESKFADVPEDSEFFEAVTYLSNEGIINGYSDGTFKPQQEVTRTEALKFILESINAKLESGETPFIDASLSEWYADYLYTAYVKKIVNGNPDGTFQPTTTVNLAAFYKILFNGMGVDINPVLEEKPYDDVELDAWFAPYISYAKELEIIDPELDKIQPDSPMTRGAVAKSMFKLMQLIK